METQPKRLRTWLVVGAATIGAALGGATIAGAATGSSGSSSSSTAATAATNNAPNPATVSHGPGETLLTGPTAATVKAAALAAVPGRTSIPVETDSAGAPYQGHVTKPAGT